MHFTLEKMRKENSIALNPSLSQANKHFSLHHSSPHGPPTGKHSSPTSLHTLFPYTLDSSSHTIHRQTLQTFFLHPRTSPLRTPTTISHNICFFYPRHFDISTLSLTHSLYSHQFFLIPARKSNSHSLTHSIRSSATPAYFTPRLPLLHACH